MVPGVAKRFKEGSRGIYGTESPSLRISARREQALGSRWFVERDYDKLLVEDVQLKAELKEKLKAAGVSSVEIERPGNKLRLIIRTARPGIIIGRKGAEIDKLKLESAEADEARRVHRHSRSEQAGARCAAGG